MNQDPPRLDAAPPATPKSRAERRAEARARKAIRSYTGSRSSGDKRAALDAAAGLRRVRHGGNGRVTPPSAAKAERAQQRRSRRGQSR